MRPRTTAALLLLLMGCPKAVPPPEPPKPPPGPTPEQARAQQVDALQAEALALVKEEGELLWAHWTRGAPLELEQAKAAHAALFEDAALAKVRAAKREPLERWLLGERLARAAADANAALVEAEAATLVTVDDKKVPWRDLSRLLANEKSAVKRKALWAAAREAVGPLGDATAKRDLAVAAALGERDLEAAAVQGQRFLDDTEVEWKQLVEKLAQSELGLSPDKISRADLPRMLRPNTAADAAFPRAEIAAKATAVLAALGLYGLPGLTLDLADSAKKNPLPLTLAPGGADDVRVSFRPAGGLRDLGSLLGELGRALALHAQAEPRLADPLVADAAYRLFAELVATPAWLKAQGVTDAAAASCAQSARALRLSTLRRAAANLVAQARPGDDPGATWNTWSSRALGVPVAPEDAPRWRLERDPLLRGVALLETQRRAEALRGKLAAQWWAEPASAAILKAAWSDDRVPPPGAAPAGKDGGVDGGVGPP